MITILFCIHYFAAAQNIWPRIDVRMLLNSIGYGQLPGTWVHTGPMYTALTGTTLHSFIWVLIWSYANQVVSGDTLTDSAVASNIAF